MVAVSEADDVTTPSLCGLGKTTSFVGTESRRCVFYDECELSLGAMATYASFSTFNPCVYLVH